MAKSTAGHVIEADFDHQLRRQRFPLFAALGAPSAGAAWCLPRKSRRFDERLEFGEQRLAFVSFQTRRKAHMMELAFFVIESQQQRAHYFCIAGIAKPPITQSAVRNFLIFCAPLRSPERYSRSNRFATTPSRGPPTSENQRSTAAGLLEACDRRMPPFFLSCPAAKASRRGRRSRKGKLVSNVFLSSTKISNIRNVAGCCFASMLTRLAAG